MAQTRTYDPSEGDDLAKLIRDAMGENVRPNEPGPRVDKDSDEPDDGDDNPSLMDLPDFNF